MAPKASGSSTTGVKKSTVCTRAVPGWRRNTPASSPVAWSTRTRGSSFAVSPPRTWASSEGPSLLAQPAQATRSVSRRIRSRSSVISPSLRCPRLGRIYKNVYKVELPRRNPARDGRSGAAAPRGKEGSLGRGAHLAVALEESAVLDHELGGDQGGLHLRAGQELDPLPPVHPPAHGAPDGDHSAVDVRVHLARLPDDQRVVGDDLPLEAPVDAEGVPKAELPQELRPFVHEAVQILGRQAFELDHPSSTPHPIPPHVGGGERCCTSGSAPFVDPGPIPPHAGGGERCCTSGSAPFVDPGPIPPHVGGGA